MVKYVPPHLRGNGKGGDEPSANDNRSSDRGDNDGGYPRGGKNKGGGYRNSDAANDKDGGKSNRFDNLGEDDPPPSRSGKGGGKRGDKGSDRNENSYGSFRSAFDSSGDGGDWSKRDDGRRPGGLGLTELEVFGPPREKSTAGIDFEKYDAIPVEVTGRNVQELKPIERFSEARLTDSLFENLRRCGYDRPTPVQKHSIPIVTTGRDLMACAQTGSGKTCAFMVPCLESLLRSGPPPNPYGGGGRRPKPMPCGLVLAPTRELASQIHVESTKFSFDTGIRCCIVYGGADMQEQKRELERGCDILIATPGRLTDMADRKNVSLELVQFFILDEADRMLDMGFEPQVRQIVDRFDMGKRARVHRQSMMFSATFPREVQYMARDFLNDYVFITVGRVGSASELVTQRVYLAEDATQKVHALKKTINDDLPAGGLAVVFVETKRGADSLELQLHQEGVAVTAIHGDRSQTEREEALAAFKSGTNPILVATDVAARGLDIPNVALVVNFDMPKDIDSYVHRVGRTGRAGRKGIAIAFVNNRCNFLHELRDLLLEAKQDMPIWFTELCQSAARPGVGGKSAGRKERYGAQDLRMSEKPEVSPSGEPKTSAVATPVRNAMSNLPPPRPANSWGNSGQEDAW